MKLFSSKKAMEEQGPTELIGIVLGVLAVILLSMIIFGIMDIFSGPPDSGSIANLDRVLKYLEALYDPANEKYDACIMKGEYLKPDWAIVGFNMDGVKSADDDIFCERGSDCVEEPCLEGNVIKPSACGKGACICLCNGGYFGNVDGDDCLEDQPDCRKLDPSLKITSFYFLDHDTKECGVKASALHSGKSTEYSVCDMVMDSEDCDGVDRKVSYGLVMMKDRTIYDPKGEEAVVFDLIMKKDELRSRGYAEEPIDCEDLIKALKKPKASTPPPAPAQQPQGKAEQEKLEDKKAAEEKKAIITAT